MYGMRDTGERIFLHPCCTIFQSAVVFVFNCNAIDINGEDKISKFSKWIESSRFIYDFDRTVKKRVFIDEYIRTGTGLDSEDLKNEMASIFYIAILRNETIRLQRVGNWFLDKNMKRGNDNLWDMRDTGV